MSLQKGRVSEYRWVILILSWLLYFSFGLIYTTLSTLVTPVMRTLNLTYFQMGIILGSWQLVYIFFAQPAGVIVDRVGPYISLFLGATIISISSALRWFATNFESLFIFVALFGVGGPLISIGLPKLTAIWFVGKERATASGIYPTGNAIGGMIALSLTNSIILPIVVDWKKVFLIYSIIGFLIAILWLLMGRRSTESNTTSELFERENIWNVMKTLFATRNIWIIVVIGIIYFLTAHGLSNWLPTILELKGTSPNEAGLIVSSLKLFGILGSVLIPRLQYLFNSKKLGITITLFVLGISTLLIEFASGPSLWITLAVAWLTVRGLLPILTVTLMDMPEVGPKRMGVIGGLFFSIGEIGGFGGPFLLGLLKDVTDSFLPGLIFIAIVAESSIILTVLLNIDSKSNGTQKDSVIKGSS